MGFDLFTLNMEKKKKRVNHGQAFLALWEQLLKYQLEAIMGAWGGSIQ